MEVPYGAFVENLKKVRKNKANVPLPKLKTTYKSGWDTLVQKTKEQSKEIIYKCHILPMVPNGYQSNPREAAWLDSYWERATQIVRKKFDKNGRNLGKDLGKIIFSEFMPPAGATNDEEILPFAEKAAGKFLDLTAYEIGLPIWYQAYGPYWIRHCEKKTDGNIWNTIVQMEWNEESGVWCHYEKGKIVSFTLMLPPTMEEIKKQESEALKEWKREA